MSRSSSTRSPVGWIAPFVVLAVAGLVSWGAGDRDLGTGVAWGYDRPDLVDDDFFSFSDESQNMSGSIVGGEEASTPFHPGSSHNAALRRSFTNDDGYYYARLFLFEPDLIKRKEAKQSLKQSAFAGLRLQFGADGTSFFGYFLNQSDLLEGCSAKIDVKDKNGDTDFETGKWKGECNSSALAALGLNPAQQAALEKLTGSSTKLEWKGSGQEAP